MNVWQIVRTAPLIRPSLGESTNPPNRQMTIVIAKIDIVVIAVGTGLVSRRLGTANARASDAASIARVPRWSRSRVAIGQATSRYPNQQNVLDEDIQDEA